MSFPDAASIADRVIDRENQAASEQGYADALNLMPDGIGGYHDPSDPGPLGFWPCKGCGEPTWGRLRDTECWECAVRRIYGK